MTIDGEKMVEVLSVEQVHTDRELFDRLSTVQLFKGPYRNVEIYDKAPMALIAVNCSDLRAYMELDSSGLAGWPSARGIWPCQTYVSRIGLRRIQALEKRMQELGQSIFELDGFCTVGLGSGDKLDILPPVLELSHEPYLGDVWLVNDGLHRMYFAAQESHRTSINVVMIWDANEAYPYYAYPATWEGVRVEDVKPPSQYAKRHRYPDRYKDFYRDFGSAFYIGRQGGQ